MQNKVLESKTDALKRVQKTKQICGESYINVLKIRDKQ